MNGNMKKYVKMQLGFAGIGSAPQAHGFAPLHHHAVRENGRHMHCSLRACRSEER